MKAINFNDYFVPTYKREGAPITHGKGMYLFDSDGNKYLDFGAGIAVNALGYNHPEILKALKEQGNRMLHLSNLYFSDAQIKIASMLQKLSFGGKVFLCNSGTEANEAAIKFARKWGKLINDKKSNILSFTDGFHGRTYGSLSATAQEKFHHGFDPILPGFYYAPFNDINKTKEVLKKHEFAAVILEPLQGEGGVNPIDKKFLTFLREYTKKNKIALIFDEIQCGMGRTGSLWYYQQIGITPDIMTLAKPLGGGLPLGAVICAPEIANTISPGDHGTTFGGNPLACALGSTVLSIVSKKKFLSEVKSKGNYLTKKLVSLQKKNFSILDVRGTGLIIGVEMKMDPTELISLCKSSGLLLIKAGHNTVRFIPPLIVSKDDIDKAVEIFAKIVQKYN